MLAGRGARWCVVALSAVTVVFLCDAAGAAKHSSTTTTTPTELELRDFSPGECVTWYADGPGRFKIKRVSCAKPHIMEMTGLSARVKDRAYPSADRWRQLINALCTPPVERYLTGPIDPWGRYSVSAIFPLKDAWALGDHSLRCSIGPPGEWEGTGARLVGRVDPTDQSFVNDTGVCLTRDTSVRTVVIDCSRPHVAEVTGRLDLSERFDHAPDAQEIFAGTYDDCRMAAESYLGRSLEEGLVPSALPLNPYSWNAGSHKVNCVVGKYENGQPVDLPGPLR